MTIEVSASRPLRKTIVSGLRRKARRILKLLDQDRVVLSLALVGDPDIQKLNARYRRKAKATDVLSFSSGEDLPTGHKLLGDVVISVEQAEKQARKRRKGLEDELEVLLIHGILHLLGYDHERSRKDEKIMFSLQRKMRRALSRDSS